MVERNRSEQDGFKEEQKARYKTISTYEWVTKYREEGAYIKQDGKVIGEVNVIPYQEQVERSKEVFDRYETVQVPMYVKKLVQEECGCTD
ncbi:unnamed protein product [Sphagnum balticum]